MSIAPCNLDEINAHVALNVKRAKHYETLKALQDKYNKKSVVFPDLPGKTIKDFDGNDSTLVLLFTDGSYIKLQYRDCLGSQSFVAGELNLEELIELGFVSGPDMVDYKVARDKLYELDEQANSEQAFRNMVNKIGLDRAKELLK